VRVACAGAGPGGLYLSILMKLADPAHEITVYERQAAGSPNGWGVTFGTELLAGLYASDPASAAAIEAAASVWKGEILSVAGETFHKAGGAHGIGRQRLTDILVSRARELGVRVEFDREVAEPALLDGADLVVASDGVNSRIRQSSSAFGTDVRVGSNKYLWLGTDKIFTPFSYLFVRTHAGWLWAGVHEYDHGASAFVVECTARTWQRLGYGAMPAEESLEAMRTIFAGHLDGHRLILHASDGGNPWRSFRTVTNQRWHDGRTVLLGDAAHTTHFSVGAGMTLAMQDAIALAAALQRPGDLEVALTAYETERQAAIHQIQIHARFSSRWMENIDRYIGLPRHQFVALLAERRAPLQARLPPRLYYQLHRLTEHVTLVRVVRGWLGRAVFGRRSRAAAR
jgi:2-polyprenyl-6-methoxyphenol hydroxylase-like FAD-dependent oxidoreductase